MENSIVSTHLGKTLTKVIDAQYAYEKAVILRKSIPKLDLESSVICRELLNELESDSIDVQNEFWRDFCWLRYLRTLSFPSEPSSPLDSSGAASSGPLLTVPNPILPPSQIPFENHCD